MTAVGGLTDDQRIAWLRLIRSDNVGPVTFHDLLTRYGDASAALAALPDLARRGGRTIRVPSADDARAELAAAEKIGARFVAFGEPGYPAWLGMIDSAPPLVAIRGSMTCLDRPVAAVVGSRNASIAGSRFAMQIATVLGGAGFTVASGLARGIDSAAHRAALSSGTVAVFAGGLDRPYPPENVELAEEIVERGGALLSEMPMGHTARGKDFPRRNRIISGLSVAVVVVEGALRSGTLITARRAAEQGRLVFAVPGSPLDPRSGAPNLLIKEGATIVTSVEDIVPEIEPMLSQRTAARPARLDEEETEIASDADDSERDLVVSAMGRTPTEVDAIIRFTGLRPAAVRLILLELELAGRLEHHQGGRVSIVD